MFDFCIDGRQPLRMNTTNIFILQRRRCRSGSKIIFLSLRRFDSTTTKTKFQQCRKNCVNFRPASAFLFFFFFLIAYCGCQWFSFLFSLSLNKQYGPLYWANFLRLLLQLIWQFVKLLSKRTKQKKIYISINKISSRCSMALSNFVAAVDCSVH